MNKFQVEKRERHGETHVTLLLGRTLHVLSLEDAATLANELHVIIQEPRQMGATEAAMNGDGQIILAQHFGDGRHTIRLSRAEAATICPTWCAWFDDQYSQLGEIARAIVAAEDESDQVAFYREIARLRGLIHSQSDNWEIKR